MNTTSELVWWAGRSGHVKIATANEMRRINRKDMGSRWHGRIIRNMATLLPSEGYWEMSDGRRMDEFEKLYPIVNALLDMGVSRFAYGNDTDGMMVAKCQNPKGKTMREGYWIHYGKPYREFMIDEHARWISDKDNAKKLGVPENVIAKVGKFNPMTDRNELLVYVLRHSPVLRVRGHHLYVSFEFASKTVSQPYKAIARFVRHYLSPVMGLHIVNWSATPPRVLDMFALPFWAKMNRLRRAGASKQRTGRGAKPATAPRCKRAPASSSEQRKEQGK